MLHRPYVKAGYAKMKFWKHRNTSIEKTGSASLVRRFGQDKRGVAAIEFALLAMPFLMVLFAVLETALSFTSQQVMSNAIDSLARDIRVGRLKKDTPQATASAITTRICDEISVLVPSGCPDLVIDMNTYASFNDIPKTIPRTSDKNINTSGFEIKVGGPVEKQMLRVFYRWKYYTRFVGDKMSEMPDGKTLLYTAVVWQNEAFAATP
jgi:Flp pilus assembly protein TadG